MSQDTKKICPVCNGTGIIPGTCECDSEWRGIETEDGWTDCQCTPDIECDHCSGTGYIES